MYRIMYNKYDPVSCKLFISHDTHQESTKMHVFTYTDVRNNLKSVLDKVIDDADVAVITRKEGQHAVVMGQAHYDSLMETLYLLSSPNNATRLNESIAQLRASKTKRMELIEDDEP